MTRHHLKDSASALALIIGLALVPLPAHAETAPPLSFGAVEDKSLAQCLNEHLGQPAPYLQPITVEQLQEFGERHEEGSEEHGDEGGHGHDEAEHGGAALRCDSPLRADITDLRGLEHLHHVEILNLQGNKITDLRPLAGMRSLKELYLRDNRVTSIASITDLPALQRVDVSQNRLADLVAFGSENQIATLDLSRNALSDLSPLTTLTGATVLHLHGNEITDLAPLAHLRALATLYIDENDVADLTPLAGLRLGTLGASANKIESIDPLRGMPLEVLYLSGNEVSALEPLREMRSLTLLHVEENQIQAVSALAGLRELSVVGLDNNRIADLSPLSALPPSTTVSALFQSVEQPPVARQPGAQHIDSDGAPVARDGSHVLSSDPSAAQIEENSGRIRWAAPPSGSTHLELVFESRDGTFSGTLRRAISTTPAASVVPEDASTSATTGAAPSPTAPRGKPADPSTPARGGAAAGEDQTLAATGTETPVLLICIAGVLLALGFAARRHLRSRDSR